MFICNILYGAVCRTVLLLIRVISCSLRYMFSKLWHTRGYVHMYLVFFFYRIP